MAQIETIIDRADGTQVRLLAQDYAVPGGTPSIGVDVFSRASPQMPWQLCNDRPHPDWRAMPVDEYVKTGRPEAFQVATRGEILRAAEQLRAANALAAPPFMPWFHEVEGSGTLYDDNCVHGQVSLSKHEGSMAVAIYEWSSEYRNQGHTVRALKWMRERGAVHIEAHGVGALDVVEGDLVPDISTMYWAHMIQKGLVDRMCDHEGVELVVREDGSIAHAAPVVMPRMRG